MSYQEYLSLLPDNTKKFVKSVLSYLKYYLVDDHVISVKGDDQVTNPACIIYTCFLFALNNLDEYKSLLASNGFNLKNFILAKNRVIPTLSEEEEKVVFDTYCNLFLIASDDNLYIIQSPIFLMKNIYKYLDSKLYSSSIDNFFNGINLNKKFVTEVEKLKVKELNEVSFKIESDVFKDVPVSVASLITTASKIRTYLKFRIIKGDIRENEYLIADDNCLVPLSILLAVYFYEGENKQSLINWLDKIGITLNKILKPLSFSLTQSIYSENCKNINYPSIAKLYKKYWESNNEVKDNIDELFVLNNVFDRNFTSSIAIEKILLNMNVDLSILDNFKSKIQKMVQAQIEIDRENYAKDFYNDLKRDTKDFINFVTRIYLLLLSIMKEGKHNADILACEDDADTLALYIASHFYGSDLEKYYVEHGVTFDKVCKLLNITITEEDIDKIPLDKRVTVDKFKKFIFEGNNRSKVHDQITIQEVISNLYKRDFNKSKIMENIFEEINKDIDLPADFESTVKTYFEQKEIDRKKSEIEEFFKDKSMELYKYLENACKIYREFVSDSKKTINDEEKVILSLLYAMHMEPKSSFSSMFNYLGLDKNKIQDANYSYESRAKGSIDIDIIKTKFLKYLTEGRNKNKKDITIDDVIRNLINPDIYQSIFLKQLLNSLNLTFEDFENLDHKNIEYKNKVKKEEKEQQVNNILKQFVSPLSGVMSSATNLYDHIIEYKNDYHLSNAYLDNPDDLSTICILIAYIICGVDNYEKILSLGLNVDYLLKKIGLPDFKINLEDTDKSSLLTVFKNYHGRYNYRILFDKMFSDVSNELMHSIANDLKIKYDQIYSILVKDEEYIETISIPERIEILKDLEVVDIPVESTSDVLEIGSNLGTHSLFINQEYTKLSGLISSDNSVELIDNILNNICVQSSKEKKKGFLKVLFKKENPTIDNYDINLTAISELKIIIKKQLESLVEQIKIQDDLGKYMELYRIKNLEYIENINEKIEKIKLMLSKVDMKVNYGEYIRLQTCLIALEKKKESFVLSDQLIRQNIASLYLSIQSLLETVVGLEISNDTLLPLIGTGVVIGKGIEAERESREVTKNIVSLLNNIINKNTEGIKDNMASLSGPLSDEQLLILKNNIGSYLDLLEQHQIVKEEGEIDPPLVLPDVTRKRSD